MASSLIWLLFLFTRESAHQEISSTQLTERSDHSLMIDGYVVSKGFNSIWLAEEPVSIKGRITGFVLSDYGSETIIVSKHKNVVDQSLFHSININQKVRVYGDYIRESNPGRISAYDIEVADE